MKEFSKSVASAGLAGVLFGARQLANVVTQPPRNGESDKATEAFNSMAQAAAEQSGDSLRETFHALDRIQRELIDTGFRFVSLDAFNSYGATDSLSGFAKQTTDQFRKWMGGNCGCGCADCSGECGCQNADSQGAGFPDAGFPDAGFPDAGFPDAGFPDAGFQDAGSRDPDFRDAAYRDAAANRNGPWSSQGDDGN